MAYPTTDMNTVQQRSFLRVPPFPGAQPVSLASPSFGGDAIQSAEIERLLVLTKKLRVGGAYWAAQPSMPDEPYILVRIRDIAERVRILANHSAKSIVCWVDDPSRVEFSGSSIVSGTCDPWHLVRGASHVIADADDELALIAAISEIPLTTVGRDQSADLSSKGELNRIFRRLVLDQSYRDPFTNQRMSPEAAIRLCGFWRRLIDSNRNIGGAIGFALWKRSTVTALLWGGSSVNFISSLRRADLSGRIAVWKSRVPIPILSEIERAGVEVIEVEDGFIRSAGLGADCVPPLSIVVDRLGVHFDPNRESELEHLIAHAQFPDDLIERARVLRRFIVASGVSKYGVGLASAYERTSDRRHILVPGQVEDDRAVLCGSGQVTGNLDLLRRVRQDRPDAVILYKPHPDVEAGHRVGRIPDKQCLEFADQVVRDQPISALIALVDELHVNTSLAGFEGLLREKSVTTHGVPFYAGWGLTRDLGPVPKRRTKKCKLDELVAAVLLEYPRYLDPKTGLPCPPEILVHRIADGSTADRLGTVVKMRRLQGKLKKNLASLRVAR